MTCDANAQDRSSQYSFFLRQSFPMKLTLLLLLLAMCAFPQCPANGQKDVIRLNAQQLAAALRTDAKTAQEIYDRIQSDGPTNTRALAGLLSDYDLTVPDGVVACPPAAEADSAMSSGISVNINSVSPKVLSDLKACGLNDAAIATLATRNKSSASGFKDVTALKTFLAGAGYRWNETRSCQGIEFKTRP